METLNLWNDLQRHLKVVDRRDTKAVDHVQYSNQTASSFSPMNFPWVTAMGRMFVVLVDSRQAQEGYVVRTVPLHVRLHRRDRYGYTPNRERRR